MLELYNGWSSSASRRVRLCLAEKKIDYRIIPVDILSFQHHSPEFLAVNPAGVVPALVDENRIITESAVICEYLEDRFPQPSVRPSDPYWAAQARNWLRYADEQCLPNIIIHNWSMVIQPIASRLTDEELERRLSRVPSKTRRENWRRVARQPYTDSEKQEALDNLVKALDRMEASLQQNPWLAGDKYSIADMGMVPFVKRIEEIESSVMSASSRPGVSDWWTRILKRPAYTEANIGSFLEQVKTDHPDVLN